MRNLIALFKASPFKPWVWFLLFVDIGILWLVILKWVIFPLLFGV